MTRKYSYHARFDLTIRGTDGALHSMAAEGEALHRRTHRGGPGPARRRLPQRPDRRQRSSCAERGGPRGRQGSLGAKSRVEKGDNFQSQSLSLTVTLFQIPNGVTLRLRDRDRD